MSAVSLVDVFREARELVSVPERWTRGAYARDEWGEFESPLSDGAVCWCMEGAVRRAVDDLGIASCGFALSALDQVISTGAASFNDSHSHAEVLAEFDRVIALVEAGAL